MGCRFEDERELAVLRLLLRFGSKHLPEPARVVSGLGQQPIANVTIFGFVEAALGQTIGFFAGVAIGFCAFSAIAVSIMLRVKVPAATPS
jgi:hypothetical protein